MMSPGTPEQRQLACLVNPASGGRAGRALIRTLGDHPQVASIVDLRSVEVEAFVSEQAASGRCLVACGGDGTASLLLGTLLRLGIDRPAGIIPLGTGNDLARSLGWRPGWGQEATLRRLLAGPAAPFDGWSLHGPGLAQHWFAYCSFGLDARITDRFQRLRRSDPWLMRSSLTNKMHYAWIAIAEQGRRLALDLERRPIADWARALAFTNIASYAGGGCLDPASDPADGLLEAFQLGGGLLLGLATRGPRRAARLGRAAAWTLDLASGIHAQVDGEPFRGPPGRYRLAWAGSLPVLRYDLAVGV